MHSHAPSPGVGIISRSIIKPSAIVARIFNPSSLIPWLIAGFIIRLVFLSSGGYTNDIQTFGSWAMTLDQRGFGGFYNGTSFVDYPPGYLYVLALVGKIYALIGHGDHNWQLLYKLIKIPAIVADVANAAIIYSLARRIAPRAAITAAALALFLPPIITISASWGQVDSVAALVMLSAVWLFDGVLRGLLRQRIGTIAAWSALAVSILIKPTSLVLAPIFLAAIFMRITRRERLRFAVDTGLGVAIALIVTYALCAPFAPDRAPLATFGWLISRYTFGSGVYAFNSVNAFNLYTIAQPMWQPDSIATPFFGLRQNLWGAGLVAVSVAAIAARVVWKGRPATFLEACMLAELAFFALATRMHERYVFSALILCIPLIARSRVFLIALGVIAISLSCNLYYSLYYLDVVTNKIPDVNAADLIPWMSHGCGFLIVATLFFLGFRFLGMLGDETASAAARNANTLADGTEKAPFASYTLARSVRPDEGLVPLTARDRLLGWGFAIASFALCMYQYWLPTEKVFDEIYYARAGAEYLKHIEQYEWTHPPFTKLVIATSMWLFGGIPGGDTSAGWRFLNVVIGSLMVGLLYRFVKRVSGSTIAASLAAGMLLFDGFHFVQSRIATPEITVAFLSLALLAFFYEYWIASQIRRIPILDAANRNTVNLIYTFFGFIGCAAGIGVAFALVGPDVKNLDPDPMRRNIDYIAFALPILYCTLGGLLAGRAYAVMSKRFTYGVAYPDGSIVTFATSQATDAEIVAATLQRAPEFASGLNTRVDGASIVYRAAGDADGTGVRCDADGSLTATSIEGGWTSRFTTGRAPKMLACTAIAGGLLAASKWNGLFPLILTFAIIAGVALQRRSAAWGNPRGFMPIYSIGVAIFAALTIYTASYIPYFAMPHKLSDAVDLQHSMYRYHHDLKATHPYQSSWWEWPLLIRPISYYYTDFRKGAEHNNAQACCVAEILALPNPVVWWGGLLSIPLLGVLAWVERRKGYALIVAAYFAQWFPWIASPRIAFEYHFFPNLALICAADAILLARLIAWATVHDAHTDKERWRTPAALGTVAAICVLIIGAFVFYYPLVSAMHIPYDAWHARIPDKIPFLRWI